MRGPGKKSYKMLAANMSAQSKQNFPDLLSDSTVAGKNVKLGIVGTVGKVVAAEITEKIDKTVTFDANAAVLPKLLKDLKSQKVEVSILLYQGTEEEAEALAKVVPGFDIILCLSPESDPPSIQKRVGGTQILRVGHKGKYVGVAALFRNKDGSFEIHSEPVQVAPQFETPAGREAENPVPVVGLTLPEIIGAGSNHLPVAH